MITNTKDTIIEQYNERVLLAQKLIKYGRFRKTILLNLWKIK